MPRLGQPTLRGDQVVNVVVDFPTRLSPKEKELLERLRDVSGEPLPSKTSPNVFHTRRQAETPPWHVDRSIYSIRSL